MQLYVELWNHCFSLGIEIRGFRGSPLPTNLRVLEPLFYNQISKHLDSLYVHQLYMTVVTLQLFKLLTIL